MEHINEFSRLSAEKQSAVMHAAMGVFAAAGYKKAYISEIAKAADISKALVFYYFGNKKSLYFLSHSIYRRFADRGNAQSGG